jgi:hypothetical protein
MMHAKYFSTASWPQVILVASSMVSAFTSTVVRGLHQIIQTAHLRVQKMDPLAASFTLVEGNPTIKLVARLSAGPFVLHGRSHFRSASILAGMKSNAPKLSAEDIIAIILLNLLLLIVQFIVLGEDLCSWPGSA